MSARFTAPRLSPRLLLLALVGALFLGWQLLPQVGAAPAMTIDGVRDAGYGAPIAADPSGDLANPGPGSWSGTAWSDLTALYCQRDATHLYVYVDLPQYAQTASSGQIGLLVNTTAGGGSADAWGNAITFNHSDRPNYLIRGNIPGITDPPNGNNGWTELRSWSGSAWSAGGTNWGGISGGGRVGTNIAYANNQGVELRIAFADLGVTSGAAVGLQFFSTQAGTTKGAYDTVPTDDQSTGWDDSTTLTQYAVCAPAATPTPSATPVTPTATPTATPVTPTATPTATPVTPTATHVPPTATPIPLTIRANSYTVAPGGSVVTVIEALNIPTAGIGALNISVAYNPTVIDLTACALDPGNRFDSKLCNPDFDGDGNDPDIVRFNMVSTAGVTGAAVELARLTFTAVGANGQTSPLAVTVHTLVNPTGQPLGATLVNGQVQIVGVPPTATPVTPTATPATPTATPVTPTATPVTPTATPVTPTATPVTPTATPVTPTATPIPLTIRANSYTVAPGGSVVTVIEALNIPTAGIGALNISVAYNPTVIDLTACALDPGNRFDSKLCNPDFDGNGIDPDIVRFNMVSTTGVTGAAVELARLTFTAVGANGQTSPLAVTVHTLVNPTGQPLGATLVNGQVQIVGVPPTATPVTPTATPVTPTATPVTPTATPVTPTATPVTPTATPVTPTATPVTPTATPVTPTATPGTPTATPPIPTPLPPSGVLVTAEIVSVAPGGQATVNIRVRNATGSNVGAANIDVVYNPAVVSVANCAVNPDGQFSSGLCNPSYAPDRVRFNILSVTGVAADARLVTLTFNALGAAGTTSPLALAVNLIANPGGQPIPFQKLDGRIDIVATTTTAIGAGQYVAVPNGNVDTQIEGRNLPANMQTVDLTLEYDPAVVRPLSCTADPSGVYIIRTCDLNADNDLVNPDRVRVVLESGGGRAPQLAAQLAVVRFRAIGGVYQSSPLAIVINELTGENGQPVNGFAQDGRLVIDNTAPTGITLSSKTTGARAAPTALLAALALGGGALTALSLRRRHGR